MTEGLLVLAELVVTLPAEVPVVGDLLGVRVRIGTGIQLYGHCEIRNGTAEVTFTLLNSTLVVIGNCKIYTEYMIEKLLGSLVIAFSKNVRAVSRFCYTLPFPWRYFFPSKNIFFA